MSSIKKLKAQLSEAQAELEDIYTMSEENACHLYNVESKDEIIQMMEETIYDLINDIDNIECKAARGKAASYFGDPAFPTAKAYYAMKL